MNRRLKQVASPWRSLWIVNQRKIARDVLLRRLGVERSYRPAALFRHPDWNFDDPLKLAVAYALRRRPDFTFLQVGAFDGRTDDPIYPLVEEFGIRGIVVEPQPEMLETLRASYACPSSSRRPRNRCCAWRPRMVWGAATSRASISS